MGKIYIKMRHDNEMNMDIPHNYNFANAMYGFRELGAEIVPYYKVADIYDLVTKEDIVIDYIDQCNRIFSKFNVHPHVPDYPECLSEFLGRKIWYDTIDSISSCEEKLKDNNILESEKDLLLHTIEDTNYQINTQQEIINLIQSFLVMVSRMN